MPIRAVMAMIDANEDAVLALVEAGDLPWSFDLALHPGRAARELRVLPAAVACLVVREPCQLEWRDVLALVLPADVEMVTTSEVARAFNVSPTHVLHLARKGEFGPCPRWRSGPSGVGKFSARRVGEFLKGRRFP